MRAKFILISLCIVGAAVMAGVYISAQPNPPTPPLLKHARASGGWWSGGCPPHANEVNFGPEARSQDVEERLASQFPAGTPDEKLARALQEQGFKLIEACDNDPQIRRASFRQEGGAFGGPYPVFAIIAYKLDATGNIAWTKAFVAYTGP